MNVLMLLPSAQHNIVLFLFMHQQHSPGDAPRELKDSRGWTT